MEQQESSHVYANVEPTSTPVIPLSHFASAPEPQQFPPETTSQFPPPTDQPAPAYTPQTAYYHTAPLPQQPNQQQQQQQVGFFR